MQKQEIETLHRNKTLERACDKAILTTLYYRSVFNSSLSFFQLGTYLITDEKVDYALFRQRLRALSLSNKVQKRKGRYFVSNQKPLSWALRARYSTTHYDTAVKVLSHLERIKWIKMLAITGSVAAHNAKKNDDIDIFIVTQKHRLWLTRFFVVLLLKSQGIYRTEEDSAGKICPNIFIDESVMAWPKEKQNVYIAHEILMMHPIINRDDTYFKFIRENKWVFDHFSNYSMHLNFQSVVNSFYSSPLLHRIEMLLMRFQEYYMKKKKTTEVTHISFIHFNKMDHSRRILEKFNMMLSGR